MSTKRWRMSVMELGSDSSVEEITIEADNWMTALRMGRSSMGESGGVPTGSSCAVAADGKVTILDPIDRRRFVLQVDTSTSYRPPAPSGGMKIPSDPVPPAAAPPSVAPQTARPASPLSPAATLPDVAKPEASAPPMAAAPRRKRAKTMAYIPDAPGVKAYQPPSPAMVRQSAPAAPPDADARHKVPNEIMAAEARAKAEAKADEEEKAAKTAEEQAQAAEALAEAAQQQADKAKAEAEMEAAGAKAEAEAKAKAKAKAKAEAEEAEAQEAEAQEAEAQEAEAQEAARLEQEAAEVAAERPNDDDAGQVGGVAWKVLHRRDSDPSDTSPLTYRERSYVVDAATSEADAEVVAIARAESLMKLLADGPQGRFINVAVFDHSWTTQPNTPPVVTVAEKDWVGRVVEYPLRTARQSAAPAPRKRATTNDQDRRLSDAFEACQDLLFVASPLEAIEFCHRLLGDLIPCAAITACLYDIDDNVHRVVAASGPGGELRRGHAIPHDAGLFGVVTASGRPLLVQGGDARVNLEHDGREGLEIENGLYLASVQNGRHLATIQMLNREGAEFSPADADLGYYIAQQLAEFLAKARGSLNPGA